MRHIYDRLAKKLLALAEPVFYYLLGRTPPATTLQLLDAGFKVIVNLGACRGVEAEPSEQAIITMGNKGAQFVDSYQQLVNKDTA